MLDFSPVMDRVYDILKAYPAARNDDKVLNERYMYIWHNITRFDECIGNDAVPQGKTIERCRREVQRYCEDVAADPEITAFRRKNERAFNKEFRKQGLIWAAKRNISVLQNSAKIISSKERKQIEKEWRKEFYNGETSDESTVYPYN